MKRAVYPGSFDPITNGHLDILHRAAQVFDEIIVLVANNPNKNSHFTAQERVEMIEEAVKDYPNIKVDSYNGLTVKYAEEKHATHLIRGLRAVTDFEYEFQLATANEFANKDIDTVFFMSRNEKAFISSSSTVQLYMSGVDISSLVPDSVIKRLQKLK